MSYSRLTIAGEAVSVMEVICSNFLSLSCREEAIKAITDPRPGALEAWVQAGADAHARWAGDHSVFLPVGLRIETPSGVQLGFDPTEEAEFSRVEIDFNRKSVEQAARLLRAALTLQMAGYNVAIWDENGEALGWQELAELLKCLLHEAPNSHLLLQMGLGPRNVRDPRRKKRSRIVLKDLPSSEWDEEE